jgi:hypothetical protein
LEVAAEDAEVVAEDAEVVAEDTEDAEVVAEEQGGNALDLSSARFLHV